MATLDEKVKNAEDGLDYLQFAFEDIIAIRQRFHTGAQVVLGSVSAVYALSIKAINFPNATALVLVGVGMLLVVGVFFCAVRIWSPMESKFPGNASDLNKFWDRYVEEERLTALAHRSQDLSKAISLARSEVAFIAFIFTTMLYLSAVAIGLIMTAFLVSNC